MSPFQDAHFLTGFGHADKKFHFAPNWAALGADHALMPRLPDQMDNIELANPDTPFRLVTAPARSFLNSSFTEMPSSRGREKRPTVLIHPDDAARLGIAEGSKVRLGNPRGEIIVHARFAPPGEHQGQQPGVLIVESIWPSECFEGGIGVNALTSDDPGPPWGGAVFHDVAVWLRAEAAQMPLAAE
jgi:anaerobic selenocysteine-containing dehydrogenase